MRQQIHAVHHLPNLKTVSTWSQQSPGVTTIRVVRKVRVGEVEVMKGRGQCCFIAIGGWRAIIAGRVREILEESEESERGEQLNDITWCHVRCKTSKRSGELKPARKRKKSRRKAPEDELTSSKMFELGSCS